MVFYDRTDLIEFGLVGINKETDVDISPVIILLFITAHKDILKLVRTHINNPLYDTRLTVEGAVVQMLPNNPSTVVSS